MSAGSESDWKDEAAAAGAEVDASLDSANASGVCSNRPGTHRSSTWSESKSYSAAPPHGEWKYQK